MREGGCSCGAIRYAAGGMPFSETFCHCSMCRRSAGAPVVAWFTVARANFHYTRGAPASYRSSAKASRTFCAACGTQLCFLHDDHPDEVDVTTCSLDAPDELPPKDHIHTASKLAWLALGDSLPRYRDGHELAASTSGDRIG